MFKLFNSEYKNNCLIIKILGIKMTFRIKFLDLIDNRKTEMLKQIENSFDSLNATINDTRKQYENIDMLKKITPNPPLQFSIDIVDHCNLNCKGCDHFCPITEEKFLSIEQYEKDIKQLTKLCGNGELIKLVCLEGGEPLLHPEINKFMEITRKYCPNSKIDLMTNAILLPNMNEEFYSTCSKYDITIAITKYPLKIDFEKIHLMAKKYNVKLFYFNDFDKREKTSWKIPFDINGTQDVSKNFLKCYMANNCITLRNGKLYTCSSRAYADRFNNYFNQNLQLSKFDELSIYDAESFQEIITFLARPIPFCKYCNIDGRKDLGKFELSKKEMSEWV